MSKTQENVASSAANLPYLLPDQEALIRAALSTPKSPWHQLLVIGNGFDLACGLPSSFSSFFDARKKFFDRPEGEEADVKYTKTIWDIILAEKHDSPWCDIEGTISEWVAPKDGRRNAQRPLTIDSTSTLFGKTLAKLASSAGRGYGVTFRGNVPADQIALYILRNFPGDSVEWTKERLLSLSREHLRLLEEDFDRYMTSTISLSKDYVERSDALIKELIRRGLPTAAHYDVERSVLNFNYTSPGHIYRTDGTPVPYVNVHGRLGHEIVFGIDGTGRMDDPDALPFTKTYRLMALDVPNVGAIVRCGAPGTGLGATDVIKFFGHSLSEPDYSYFQAIFDAVNLYEGKTRLVFFARPYGKKTEDDVRREMMDKVIALLSGYGKTLDNKEHGKNLIHRLLIEGRLKIEIIKDERAN